MERDRTAYNRTDGTSLEAAKAPEMMSLENSSSVRRDSGEAESQEDEGSHLRIEESIEGDQMLPNAVEDSILSMSQNSLQIAAQEKKEESSQMADMSQ